MLEIFELKQTNKVTITSYLRVNSQTLPDHKTCTTKTPSYYYEQIKKLDHKL